MKRKWLNGKMLLNWGVKKCLTTSDRLNEGYIPSVEEMQGYYLSLTVFKNVLASAPYQEVLLTTNGRRYQTISREDDGTLVLEQVEGA